MTMPRSSSARVLFGVTLALLSPAVARAQPPAVEATAPPARLRGLSLSVDYYNLGRHDEGYRLFDEGDRKSTAGFEANYELLSFGPRGRLAMGAGYLGEEDARSAGIGRATLDTHSFYATAIFRLRVLRWLEPYVTLAGGGAFAEARLAPGSGPSLSADARSVFGRGGLGVRLVSPPARPRNPTLPTFGFAFSIEGGASVGTPLDFDLRPPAPGDAEVAADLIPVAGVRLGDLQQVRTYVRLGFALLL